MVAEMVRFEEAIDDRADCRCTIEWGKLLKRVAVEPRTIWNGELYERFLIPFWHCLS